MERIITINQFIVLIYEKKADAEIKLSCDYGVTKVEENYKNELFAGDKIVKVNGRTDIDIEFIINHECTLTIERLVNFKIRVIHSKLGRP